MVMAYPIRRTNVLIPLPQLLSTQKDALLTGMRIVYPITWMHAQALWAFHSLVVARILIRMVYPIEMTNVQTYPVWCALRVAPIVIPMVLKIQWTIVLTYMDPIYSKAAPIRIVMESKTQRTNAPIHPEA